MSPILAQRLVICELRRAAGFASAFVQGATLAKPMGYNPDHLAVHFCYNCHNREMDKTSKLFLSERRCPRMSEEELWLFRANSCKNTVLERFPAVAVIVHSPSEQ